MCLNLAVEADQYDRFLIATDTPTGTGVMPLGMIKSVCELSCLSDYPAEMIIAAATGNVAKVYRLETGFLKPGLEADVLVLDAPLGCSKGDALGAIKNGDYPAIAACFTSGVPRFIGRSRNTPPPTRKSAIAKNNQPNMFSPASHV